MLKNAIATMLAMVTVVTAGSITANKPIDKEPETNSVWTWNGMTIDPDSYIGKQIFEVEIMPESIEDIINK